MDYDIICGGGFCLAIYLGCKAYQSAVFRFRFKIFGALAFVLAAAAVTRVTAYFADTTLHRECAESHDPAACIADQEDPN